MKGWCFRSFLYLAGHRAKVGWERPFNIAVVGERGTLKKVIVYPASHLYYQSVLPAVKSALLNGHIDDIYLMIDEDEYPGWLPDNVHTINVAKQLWFKREECPNYRNDFSFICLVRVALAKYFPDLDRILSLDADTIITGDLTELWDLDLTDYYLAGVPEVLLSEHLGRPYINAGMSMFNLAKIRQDHLDDHMIEDLNNTWYQWVEQDCINTNCIDHVLPLSSTYNASQFTAPVADPKILHFAFTPGWEQREIVKHYRAMEWPYAGS